MPLNVPGLWFMSWYDVSVGPNLALYNHVRKTAKADVADQQWAIIAPVAHCAYTRATEDTIVGERSMGDARLDYSEIMYGFFDRFLKGEQQRAARRRCRRSPTSRWASTSGRRPTRGRPTGAQPMTFYLSSGGKANTLNGDGALTPAPPDADTPDAFTYDPMNPVTSYGGNVCCTGNAIQAGVVRSAQDGSARGHPRLHVASRSRRASS